MIKQQQIKQFLVEPGSKVDLKDRPTDWTETEDAEQLGKDKIKERAAEILEEGRQRLDAAQQLLYASDTHSLLLVFQAMDAAGKDGTIRHVMSGTNPQGCQVFSFKKPSAEDLDHNFLWRYMKSLPERGRIGIFNRSYYEDVLVVKVHPEWMGPGMPKDPDEKFWHRRYDDINNFEKHLVRNGTVIVKFYLHLSKGEQRRRFLARLEDPSKHWKFSDADLAEREHWKAYQKAYEDALSATSTKRAPWYVIPADRKYVARALIADIVVKAIEDLDLSYPQVSQEKLALIEAAKAKLDKKPDEATGDGKGD